MEPKTPSECLEDSKMLIWNEIAKLRTVNTAVGGLRDISVAITNLETGLLWLEQARQVQHSLETVPPADAG